LKDPCRALNNCLNFNFRRAERVWPFRKNGRDYALSVQGTIEANNGETLGQLPGADRRLF
jgi:hypothetical protein